MSDMNMQAIKTLEVMRSVIAFGDVEVSKVEYYGDGILVKGEYTDETKKRKNEQLADELFDMFNAKIKYKDKHSESLPALAQGMIEMATYVDIPKETIEVFKNKIQSKYDISI